MPAKQSRGSLDQMPLPSACERLGDNLQRAKKLSASSIALLSRAGKSSWTGEQLRAEPTLCFRIGRTWPKSNGPRSSFLEELPAVTLQDPERRFPSRALVISRRC